MPFKAIDLNLNIFCVHMIHICMKSAVRKNLVISYRQVKTLLLYCRLHEKFV